MCQCCVNLKSDEEEKDCISAPFNKEIRFIFQGFETDTDNCQGFRDATRSLIVDNILRNMNFNPQENGEDESIIDTAKQILSGLKSSVDPSDASSYMKMFVAKKLNLEKDEQNTLLYPGLPYMLGYFNLFHDMN